MFGFFKKKKVEETKKSAKEIATDNKEPYIAILSVDIDEKDPGNGAFELDWNEYFITKLARSGYTGRDDEQIVDQWFQDVCRHVVLETYEQYEANDSLNIDKRDLGNGRSEFS